MKNFLYKLIFPESGKLYIGRSTNETRYSPNKPNEQFSGPHHNCDVQTLLDSGEFCYFHVIREFETFDELKSAEDDYLKKVWKTDDWNSRPKWLLNRNRNSIGFSSGENNPIHLLSNEEKRRRAENMRENPEGKLKKRETHKRHKSDPNFIHGNTGRPRPDMKKPQTQKQKDSARKSALRKFPCPHCGREMNAGNLSQHILRKH